MKEALIEAGKRLLAERPPSAIAAREIAAEAGVNYGFVHHYFRGKAGLLRAAMLALRDDFLARHPRPEELSLLTGERDPFLAGLGRSQVDYPNELGGLDVNLIGRRLVAAVGARSEGGGTDADAKARAIALMALQIAYGIFGRLLRDEAAVSEPERADVEEALRAIYDEIALVERPISEDSSL